jgi:hypothetical protein
MRWPWARSATVAADAGRLAPLERVDVEGLEILELDDDDRRVGAPEPPPRTPIRELGYATGGDGTGVAGLWQVLAER